MTGQQMRDRFFRRVFQAEGAAKWTPAEADEFLKDSLEELTRDYRLYTKYRVVPVAAQTNQFALSSVQPTAVAGESFRLHEVQYMEGKSGTFASFADGTGGTVLCTTSAVHGLSDGDTVEIFDSTNYTGRWTIDTTGLTTSQFKITTTYVAESPPAACAWVQASGDQRFTLNLATYEEVQGQYDDFHKPTSADVPQGTLFFTWLVTSRNIPALGTDLDDQIAPPEFQGNIADLAAIQALMSVNDARLEGNVAMVERAKKRMAEFSEFENADSPVYFGRMRMTDGLYAFRQTDARAFVFWPRTW